MLRGCRALVCVLFLFAWASDLFCWCEKDLGDCCPPVACSICTHSVLYREVPVLPVSVSRVAMTIPTALLQPDDPSLAHLTPPPKPLA